MWSLQNLKTARVRFIAEDALSRLDVKLAGILTGNRGDVHVATPRCAPVAVATNSEHLRLLDQLFFAQRELDHRTQTGLKRSHSSLRTGDTPMKFARFERGLNLADSLNASGGCGTVTLSVNRAASLMTRCIINSPIESSLPQKELASQLRGENLPSGRAAEADAGTADNTVDAQESARPRSPLMPTSFYARARSAIRNRPIRRSKSSS